MNRRDAESDPALRAVGKIEELLLQGWFVEIRPLFAFRAPAAHAWVLIQIIKMFETVFGQQIVNDEASLAAKTFLAASKSRISADVPTMETTYAVSGMARPCRGQRHGRRSCYIQKVAQFKN